MGASAEAFLCTMVKKTRAAVACVGLGGPVSQCVISVELLRLLTSERLFRERLLRPGI